MQTECYREKQYRDAMIKNSVGWFTIDKEKNKKAKNIPLPSCNEWSRVSGRY